MKQGDSISFKLKKLPPETFVEIDKTLLPLSFDRISESRRKDELLADYFTHQKLLLEIKLEI